MNSNGFDLIKYGIYVIGGLFIKDLIIFWNIYG